MKKFLFLLFTCFYVFPASAGFGKELRRTATNLDLSQPANIQLDSLPLPGINFLVSSEIGLNHQVFSG